MQLPITAIIVTKNEEQNIADCLETLQDFSEVIVVDSGSTDGTIQIAKNHSVKTINFNWNGQYPKKRQWCLDHITTENNWIFFIDADEKTTPEFLKELRKIDWNNSDIAGYFVRSNYVLNNKILRRGLQNNKLCLLHKNYIEFPIINDIDIEGMGEIEGHYQPVLKTPHKDKKIGQIKTPILHNALLDRDAWNTRHERYARWEVEMDKRKSWPQDPSPLRRIAKTVFKALPFRSVIAFLHSWIWKLGFLDGKEGWALAASRHHYYSLFRQLSDKERQSVQRRNLR